MAYLNKGFSEAMTCIPDEILFSNSSGLLCTSIQFKLVVTHDEPRVSFAVQMHFHNCYKERIYWRERKEIDCLLKNVNAVNIRDVLCLWEFCLSRKYQQKEQAIIFLAKETPVNTGSLECENDMVLVILNKSALSSLSRSVCSSSLCYFVSVTNFYIQYLGNKTQVFYTWSPSSSG